MKIILFDIFTLLCVSDNNFKKIITCEISCLNAKWENFQNIFELCRNQNSKVDRITINIGLPNKYTDRASSG